MMRTLLLLPLLAACHPAPTPTTPRRQARPASPGVAVASAASQPTSAPASQPAKVKVRPPLLPTGSLDHAAIRDTIDGGAAALRRCHETTSPRHPLRAGQMQVRLVVSARGAVREARIEESTLKEPPLLRCVLAVMRAWTFPAPRGGEVVVNTPLYFGKKR